MSTRDIREDLRDNIFANFFDYSTLNRDDPMYDGSKESKVGYWKIETGSDTILSSAGIRPKVYSLQYVSAKILKEINKRLVTMNKELKKMKMKTKCIRELSYMFDEMKRLKGVYPFTQHKEKNGFFFLDAIKMSLILPYFLGVKKHLIRQNFSHHRFVKSVFEECPENVRYFTIASRKHHISTNLQSKIGLSR